MSEPFTPEFLVPLRLVQYPFPQAELERLAAQPERAAEVVKYLEALLALDLADDLPDGYFLPIFSCSLLGIWRTTAAYPLVGRLLSLPEEDLDYLIGDFLLEGMNQVFAAVSGGDQSGIRALIENERAYEFARACGVDSLMTLHVEGVVTREEMEQYFDWLLTEGLERTENYVWNAVIFACADLRLTSLLPLIKKAFKEGVVPMMEIDILDVLETIEKPAESLNGRVYQYPDAIIEELSTWDAFTEEGVRECFESDSEDEEPEPEKSPAKSGKIGRNDPCTCGSGKKFKNCCGLVG